LNATTGEKVWIYRTGGYILSSPAVAGDAVYINSFDNDTYALNASTGILLWKITIGHGYCMQSSPSVYKGLVYTGSYTWSPVDKIYALNATTGKIVWNYTTGGGVWSSPAISDGTVFVGSGDDKLYALNAVTGTLQWSYKTNGPIYSSPAIAEGTLFVGSYDNNIYAIGPIAPTANSGKPSDYYFVIVAGLTIVFVAAAIISLRLRRRKK
jgi:outer membrane protein assembly factor BamB